MYFGLVKNRMQVYKYRPNVYLFKHKLMTGDLHTYRYFQYGMYVYRRMWLLCQPSPKNWVFGFFRLGLTLGSGFGACWDRGLGTLDSGLTKTVFKKHILLDFVGLGMSLHVSPDKLCHGHILVSNWEKWRMLFEINLLYVESRSVKKIAEETRLYLLRIGSKIYVG